MKAEPDIDAPIFILGMPRSGTSVFYESLAKHPCVVPVTHASKKFPRSPPLIRLMQFIRPHARPTEGHALWGKFCREDEDVLEREDVDPNQRRYFRQIVAAHLAVHPHGRFVCKHPRNAFRIGYFGAIFPRAVFIHMLRDARAVVRSFLEKLEQGHSQILRDILPPGRPEPGPLDPIEDIAWRWTSTVDFARTRGRELGDGRYCELRYEDFCCNPTGELDRVSSHCGIEWPEAALRQAVVHVSSRNDKWRHELTREQNDRILDMAGEALRRSGYGA
jgi:hypothetical protein